ncbi:MAG: DMT family transporter [Hyphomicrobiaceae bacterium]
MIDPVIIAAAIALAVSVNFGIASHIQHIAVDHMDAGTGTLVNIATTALILTAFSPLYLVPETLLTMPVAYFVAAGLIVPSLSITVSTTSVKIIGPGLTAGLAATSPIFAMVIAVLFLGEIVTAQILLGTLIVIAGVMLIAGLRSRSTTSSWPLWAIALPLIAALTRGISHPLIKLGLTGLPSPMTAALVSSSVSLVVLGLVRLGSQRRLPAWNRGYLWFALGGVINGVGIVGMAIALSIGSVIVVSPLIATTPVFTLLLGYLFFRRETITWPTVAAIVLIFAGCVLIILR